MFAEAVLSNVVLFAIGQAFAWLYLRSGRFWLGVLATTALWVAIDWWLVVRYIFGVEPAGQRLPLLLLQATAIAVSAAYLWALVRRRRAAGRRTERFRTGIEHLLAGRLEPALVVFRELTWNDPWDAPAWIARGDVERRSGNARRARSCYQRAQAVDTDKGYLELLTARLQSSVQARVRDVGREPQRPAGRPRRVAKTG